MLKRTKLVILMLAIALFSIALVACGSDSASDHTHDYLQTTVPPTCKDSGYVRNICKICGHSKHTDFVLEKGHTSGEWEIATEASCTTSLQEVIKCTVCNVVLEKREGAKLPHKYEESIVSPTCKEQGYTVHTCVDCGDTYNTNYTPVSTEHIAGDWVTTKNPTCISTGTRSKYCKICAKELETGVVAQSTLHDYSTLYYEGENNVGSYIKYTCNICKHEKTIDQTSTMAPSEIYELIANATVRIEAYDKDGNRISTGSGFFITDDGNVATNFHVISGARSAKIFTYSGIVYDVVDVLGYDIVEDVAVIKTNATKAAYLELATTTNIKTGDYVYALGNPMGIDNIFSSGIISNTSKIVAGCDMFSYTAPISTGNSGGPLVNDEGRVIGINSRTALDAQNLNFAVRSERISELELDKNQTLEQIYQATLMSNAYQIIANYIAVNKHGALNNGDSAYIYKLLNVGTSTTYGRECYFIYDSEAKKVILRLNILSYEAVRFEVQIEITADSSEYKITLFDYNMGQITIDADVISGVAPDGENIDETLIYNFVKYVDSETEKNLVSAMKSTVYKSYIYIMQEFKELLENSGTDLTLEHFNFDAPTLK